MKSLNITLLLCLILSIFLYSCEDEEPMEPDPIDVPNDTMTVDTMMNTDTMMVDTMNIDTMNVDTMMVDTMTIDTMNVDTMVTGNPNATVYEFTIDDYSQEAVQEAMILMDEEDTIKFGAGTFAFENTLSVDEISQYVIMGAGLEETILDFTGQLAGAEGLKITNGEQIILANLTVQNTIGDAIKVKDCAHFTFYNVATVWTGEASESNGAYGIYPVNCEHVLIDGCTAYGASDAGIYVGQTNYVIVRNSHAERNVAGIEIENTKYADVYDNTATGNTAGILVFDLPGLSQYGEQCRIFNNTVHDNSFPNFAPSGNIVGVVPNGTGIMALATKDVEIFDNDITLNNIMGVGLIDYAVLADLGDETWDDPNYITTPRGIYVHDNNFERTTSCPGGLNDMGIWIHQIMYSSTCEIQDILWSGMTEQSEIEGEKACFENNGDASWVNLKMGESNFGNLKVVNPEEFVCTGASFNEVVVEAPMLP